MFTLAGWVDLVIVMTLVECALLLAYHRRSGAGVAPHQYVLNMVSGVCLMLALHCAVRDTHTAWIALFMCLAGIAHALDLRKRWVRRADAA